MFNPGAKANKKLFFGHFFVSLSVFNFQPPGTGKSLVVNAAVSDAKESNYIWVSAYELRYDRYVYVQKLVLTVKYSNC